MSAVVRYTPAVAQEHQARAEAASKSPNPPFRQMTPEEVAARPAECAGCGRDAVVWVWDRQGGMLGYCGYLDSGGCLAVVMLEAAK